MSSSTQQTTDRIITLALYMRGLIKRIDPILPSIQHFLSPACLSEANQRLHTSESLDSRKASPPVFPVIQILCALHHSCNEEWNPVSPQLNMPSRLFLETCVSTTPWIALILRACSHFDAYTSAEDQSLTAGEAARAIACLMKYDSIYDAISPHMRELAEFIADMWIKLVQMYGHQQEEVVEDMEHCMKRLSARLHMYVPDSTCPPSTAALFAVLSARGEDVAQVIILGLCTYSPSTRAIKYEELHAVSRCLVQLLVVPSIRQTLLCRNAVGLACSILRKCVKARMSARGQDSAELRMSVFNLLVSIEICMQYGRLAVIDALSADIVSTVLLVGQFVWDVSQLYPGGDPEETCKCLLGTLSDYIRVFVSCRRAAQPSIRHVERLLASGHLKEYKGPIWIMFEKLRSKENVLFPMIGLGYLGCAMYGKLGATIAQESKVRLCSGCHIACYCSKECQKADWRTGGHREQCPYIAKIQKSGSSMQFTPTYDVYYIYIITKAVLGMTPDSEPTDEPRTLISETTAESLLVLSERHKESSMTDFVVGVELSQMQGMRGRVEDVKAQLIADPLVDFDEHRWNGLLKACRASDSGPYVLIMFYGHFIDLTTLEKVADGICTLEC